MTKISYFVLYCLLFLSLMGCQKEELILYKSLHCGFVTSEILVEVTAETKSFRIEVGWPPEHPDTLYMRNRPDIYIVKDATTAKHKIHFVNTPGVGMGGLPTIGRFLVLEGTRKAYKDVTVIPENITEQVVITYTSLPYRIEGSPIEDEGGLFNQLTVTLKPKSSE